jgi:hypothetical protein
MAVVGIGGGVTVSKTLLLDTPVWKKHTHMPSTVFHPSHAASTHNSMHTHHMAHPHTTACTPITCRTHTQQRAHPSHGTSTHNSVHTHHMAHPHTTACSPITWHIHTQQRAHTHMLTGRSPPLTCLSSRLLSRSQAAALLRAAAAVFVRHEARFNRTTSLHSVLSRSGLGSDIASEDAEASGESGGVGESASPAGSGGRKGSVKPATTPDDVASLLPCLGPIVTLSDTKQTVVVHLHHDVSIVGWASHFSPRKYDVKAGKWLWLQPCVCTWCMLLRLPATLMSDSQS